MEAVVEIVDNKIGLFEFTNFSADDFLTWYIL